MQEISKFKDLALFFLHLLTLAHSNATIERAFSDVKNTKNDKRQSLYTSTLEALMIIRYYFKNNEFELNDELIKL